MIQARQIPSARDVAHLRASDAAGAWIAIGTCAATAAGLWLSSRGGGTGWIAWVVGQVILAGSLVQWFILLHECGHGTLFASRRANTWTGRLAGFFALIPFHVWTRVHGRHHRWTGWQDVDPTTATLVRSALAPWERVVVNVCWRCWIPIFAVLYRLNNFWHLPRLARLMTRDEWRPVARSAVLTVVALAAAIIWIGPVVVLTTTGAALALAFVAEDVLLISQHTHLPMSRSGGAAVRPYAAAEQEQFTRSLRLPAWLSRLALHFDAHELHHMFPSVPGYRLDEIDYAPEHEVPIGTWVPAARAVPGAVLLFQSRNESGFDL
jgi:omega-6 fatty acid desaturase (delta-12 desaturase)